MTDEGGTTEVAALQEAVLASARPWIALTFLQTTALVGLAWLLMQKADPIVLEGVACKVTTLRAGGTR